MGKKHFYCCYGEMQAASCSLTTCTCPTYANNGRIATVPVLLNSNNESDLHLLRYIVVHQHGRRKTDLHGK